MAECFRCGVSDEQERLFDAISGKGVVKICENCAKHENLPLVQPVELVKPEKSKTVYERLSNMAKLDPEKHRSMLLEKAKNDSMEKQRSVYSKKQDTTLKAVIDSNFQKKNLQPRTDLVDNFHWILMRARRSKKLSQKQLAENIGEPESLIINAEAGIIPNNSDSLVRKLENYFVIKIKKTDSPYSGVDSENVSKQVNLGDPAVRDRFEKEGKFDKEVVENLTISDLQEIDSKDSSEEKRGLFSFFRRKRKKSQEEDTQESEEEAPTE